MIKTLHVKILFFLSVFAAFAFSAKAQTTTEEYYLNATGKTGGELKTALHYIIHDHTELPYTSSDYDVWDALKETDEDPDNTDNVLLIYTNRSEPKANQDTGSGDDDAWNREHIWAKSHGDFGTEEGAGTDIHHLRACDRSVNSDRSNLFFDEGGVAHSEATECYYDNDSWEPRDAVKGDIARMIFYMAVCYEGEDGDPDLEMTNDMTYSKDNYTEPYFGKLSTLIAWNTEDPVDSTEIIRNEKVYAIQGNRNPFIDHSEWVDSIWVETDSNAPMIASLSPENASVSVSLTADLSISFTEEILVGTGNINILRYSDDSVLESIDVTGDQISITNNTVTIDLENSLEEETQYYIQIDSGAFTDSASNVFDGISDNTIWTFTSTATPPSIVSTNPENGSKSISIDTNLAISFSEVVAAGSGNISIYQYADNALFESINIASTNVTFSNDTVYINPENSFDRGTKYYVTIDSAAITDTSLNAFEGIESSSSWNFTTIYPAPLIVELFPTNNSTNVAFDTDLEITFDQEIEAGNGYISIYNDGIEIMSMLASVAATFNGEMVTIELSEDLESNTDYYVLIDEDAFVNSEGVAFAGISSSSEWSFTSETATGIEDVYSNNGDAPSFYPNPARTEIYLTNMDNVESMHITNLTGRRILELLSPDSSISVSDLPKGIYFVTFVSTSGSSITKKLLKQ
ncbi:Ig-like domain-containing protein [Labilibaculum sp.]|uniref:Ig-like domain-containing protein n=1 Tax=Labilibaculum sp. TaxID=2060723 RepID=UPI00356263EC